MPKRTKKNETKPIEVATLFLTALSILITAIVGIYLAFRNENLQKQLLDLQNQYNYAALEVDYDSLHSTDNITFLTATSELVIKNKGPAIAKNVRVSICLYKIDDNWLGAIDDIRKFDITVSTLLYPQKEISSNCESTLDESVNDNIVFTIDSVPPNQEARFNIGRKNIDTEVVRETIRVHLLLPNSIIPHSPKLPLYQFYFKDHFLYFLKQKYRVAEFYYEINCDNCNSIEWTPAPLDRFPPKIPVIQNIEVNNERIIEQTSSSTEEEFDLTLEYVVPKGYIIPKQDHLYLIYQDNEESRTPTTPKYYLDYLKEISQDVFEACKKSTSIVLTVGITIKC